MADKVMRGISFTLQCFNVKIKLLNRVLGLQKINRRGAYGKGYKYRKSKF